MPVELTAPAGAPPKKEWVVTGRFVLVCLLAFFAVVATVNGVMMTLAIKTFSGVDAGRNGYEKSQGYNAEIAEARAQASLGWTSSTTLTAAPAGPRLGFTLKDAKGAAVSGLTVSARLGHPSDRRQDHEAILAETSPGDYGAVVAAHLGAWDVTVSAARNGERIYLATSRVILR